MASTIFVELKRQFELAKIEEVKSLTVVNVLDKGQAPSKKDRPKRATNAAIGFLVTMVAVSLFYAMKPVYAVKKDQITAILSSKDVQ